MSGRKEKDRVIEEKINIFIKDKPDYLSEYKDSLSGKTALSKKIYIEKTWKFLVYLQKKKQIDIYNIQSICNIKPSLIEGYMGTLNVKNITKATIFYAIKNFFAFLENDEYIVVNPCLKISAPRDNEIHEVVYLTQDEINQIKKDYYHDMETATTKEQKLWGKRNILIIMLGISTGMRCSSIVEIDIDDIDFTNKHIKIMQKGNKQLLVPLSDNVLQLIYDWLNARNELVRDRNCTTNALFVSEKMVRIDQTVVRYVLNKYTKNINKNITPHKLRSTCATQLIKQTGNIYLASHILGHANVETTKRYAAIDSEMEEQAVEAMDKILF